MRDPVYITTAERKVLALLCRGLSNIEIGMVLRKSPLTIKNQVQSLIRAFQGRSRLDVAVRALQSGIVRLGDLEVIDDENTTEGLT